MATNGVENPDEPVHNIEVLTQSRANKDGSWKASKDSDKEYLELFKPAPPGFPRWLTLVNIVIILGLVSLMVWFTITIVKQYHDEAENPPTQYKIIPPDSVKGVEFPSVTICSIDYKAELTFVYCDSGNDCDKDVHIRNIGTPEDPQNCYVFNPYNGNRLRTKKSGISSGVALFFHLALDKVEEGDAKGVFVYFQDNEFAPYEAALEDIADTTYYAPPDIGTVFSLKKVSTKYYNQTTRSVPTNPTVYYDAAVSNVGFEKDGNTSTVFIIICYNDLAVTTITQQRAYKIQNLLGDFAGMMGTLVGIDIWKIVLSLEVLPWVIAAFGRWVRRRQGDGEWNLAPKRLSMMMTSE